MTTALAQVDREKIYQWINELSSPETRENALLELSKKRESVPDLAPMLWHSCGTIAALLQVKGRAIFITTTLWTLMHNGGNIVAYAVNKLPLYIYLHLLSQFLCVYV